MKLLQIIFLFTIFYFLPKSTLNSKHITTINLEDTLPKSMYQIFKESNIYAVDTCYVLSLMESGRFTSRVFKENNNLFGLHNGKEFLKFNSIEHCLEWYKNYQEKRYVGKFKNYFEFIHYSCKGDTNYVHSWYSNQLEILLTKLNYERSKFKNKEEFEED